MVDHILVGDVSAGTTRFALVSLSDEDIIRNRLPKLNVEKVATSDIIDFSEQVIVPYLKGNKLELKDICQGVFAPAGVIENDGKYCRLTNGGLELDTDKFGFPAKLFNDFVAKAKYVAEGLRNNTLDSMELLGGAVVKQAPIVLAGVGSGYGVCILRWDEGVNNYVPTSTELSHQPLGINLGDKKVPNEYMIFNALREKLGVKVLSWEDFLSTKKGGGIENAFEIISRSGIDYSPDEYLAAENKAAWIHVSARTASEGSVLDRFNRLEWEVIGRSLRSFSVGNLARGGIYLTSGMAQNNIMIDGNRRNPDWRLVDYMGEGFSGYSAHEEWSKEIPVRLIAEKEDGLHGAAYLALDLLRRRY